MTFSIGHINGPVFSDKRYLELGDLVCFLVRTAMAGPTQECETSDQRLIEKLNSMQLEEWEELEELAYRHQLTLHCLDAVNMLDIQIPRREKMQMILTTVDEEKRYRRQCRLIREVVDYLLSGGVRTMILKGIGLSLYYPRPNHRMCGDCDIYLFGDFEKAEAMLREWPGRKIDIHIKQHHNTFHLGEVMFENHYDFVEAYSRGIKLEEEKTLKALAAEGKETEVEHEQIKFWLPSAELNALFLILHASAHFSAGSISIRHCLDWARFIEKNWEKTDWKRLFALYERFGVIEFVLSLNALCTEHLGMPEINHLCHESYKRRYEGLSQRIWLDILRHGERSIPENFFIGWAYRIWRRFQNGWKAKLVYAGENSLKSFWLGILIHILSPATLKKMWGKDI